MTADNDDKTNDGRGGFFAVEGAVWAQVPDQSPTPRGQPAKLISRLPRRPGMAKSDPFQTSPASVKLDALDEMSKGEFVKGWKALVGEPPAIMLDSRTDMVRVLVESVPVATPDLAGSSVTNGSKSKKLES